MLKKIHSKGLLTHMPFLTKDEKKQRVLFFCQADESYIWKIHFKLPEGEIQRLVTGLSEEVCECSPTAWCDEAGWHVSFVAGGAEDNPLFHLYRMDGVTLTQMNRPIAVYPTKAGFIFQDRLVYADFENLIYIHQPAGDFEIELPGAFIYRVAYQVDLPDKLLISGQWQTETDFFTLEYDLKTGEQSILECDGDPAYKCTILGEEVIYAKRAGENLENRQVITAKGLNRRPVKAATRRLSGEGQRVSTRLEGNCAGCKKDRIKGNSITRSSCLECIEKHLGAALILLTETREGYVHRLRVIGHLHEAEDESQEWQELHTAIREARKQYQMIKEIPDWDKLGEKIQAIKDNADN